MAENDGWMQEVESYVEALGSPRTQRRYRDALLELTEWYQGSYGEDPSVRLLTDVELQDWRAYLQTVRGLGASSVNLRLAAVKGLLRAHGRELRVKGVRQESKPVDVLTSRDLGRLLATLEGESHLNKRNVALVNLMARAGLRVGEVVSLEIGDLSLRPRSGFVLVRHGKGLKERKVPLGARVREELREYLKVRPEGITTDRIFVSHTGKPIRSRDVQRVVAEATRIAGIQKDVTPHILRHTFASRYLEKNPGKLAVLSNILGHRHVITTTRYLHPTTAQVQATVENL